MRQVLEQNKPLADLLKGWLGIGAVVCAGVLAPVEYLDVKQEKRVERTLSYVERYGDRYADAAAILDEAIDVQFAQLSSLLTDTTLSAEELSGEYTTFIMTLFADGELRTAMNSVLRFHEELAQCITNHLCDKEVAMSFFSNSAGDMLRTYYPYICDKRSKWNDPEAYQSIEHLYLGESVANMCENSN